jgi:cytochrome P450
VSRLPTTFPFDRKPSCPFAQPPVYAELRAWEPVSQVELPSGGRAWLVTRIADARTVLSDVRFSNDSRRAGYPVLEDTTPDPGRTPMFVELDPPEHTSYRRMLMPEFTRRRAEETRSEIEREAGELVDRMLAAGNSADLVRDYALALPSAMICDLLGIPVPQRDTFRAGVTALFSTPYLSAEFGAAFDEMARYVGELVAAKMTGPADDLIGRLITGPMAAGELTHEELAGMATVLLAGGYESTANMISLGVLHLIRTPELVERLRGQPDRYPDVVDELLRYHSIADRTVTRVAVEDVVLGGRLIKAGDGVVVAVGAVNHDESVFPEPATLDIDRPHLRHLAFGYGHHQCIGMNLARVELEIAYRTLFDGIPGLRLDVPFEDLRFKYGTTLFGLHELPVVW